MKEKIKENFATILFITIMIVSIITEVIIAYSVFDGNWKWIFLWLLK